VVGIALGLLLCIVQQQYGFIKMGNADGTYIVNAYPVSVHYEDVLLIFVTVIVAGWLAVWYPVRALSRRLLEGEQKG
jgi:lipoprotein-releasing system permease protein